MPGRMGCSKHCRTDFFLDHCHEKVNIPFPRSCALAILRTILGNLRQGSGRMHVQVQGVFVGGGGGGISARRKTLAHKFGNRHGLIAGATGTGEDHHHAGLGRGIRPRRRAGLPNRHQRGDVSGIAVAGQPKGCAVQARRHDRAGRLPFRWQPNHPVGFLRRAWPPACAPPLPNLARFCCRGCWTLTEAQEGVINVAFRIAR